MQLAMQRCCNYISHHHRICPGRAVSLAATRLRTCQNTSRQFLDQRTLGPFVRSLGPFATGSHESLARTVRSLARSLARSDRSLARSDRSLGCHACSIRAHVSHTPYLVRSLSVRSRSKPVLLSVYRPAALVIAPWNGSTSRNLHVRGRRNAIAAIAGRKDDNESVFPISDRYENRLRQTIGQISVLP